MLNFLLGIFVGGNLSFFFFTILTLVKKEGEDIEHMRGNNE